MNRSYQNNQRQRRDHRDTTQLPSSDFNSQWIKEGADKQMIAFCDAWGKYLKESKISSSQLRNIYGEIMRIKLKGITKETASFYLLKPKIAYNASRIDRKNEKEAFVKFINKALYPALETVDTEQPVTFDNFQKFFEAVLAYHKYYGGK